jgi:adenylate cyclase
MKEDGANLTRRLAAIFYADVEGYTRLTALDEIGTHRKVVAALRLMTERIASHGGRVGHYAGDAVLADFDAPVSAIECAAAIQREFRERESDSPLERRVQFRIGINFESVIVDQGAVHGGGVNVAARIEALAEPGGICISGSVFDAVGSSAALQFEFLGEQALKNLDRPIRAYRVLLDTDGRPSDTAHQTTAETEPRPIIAVLPFENLRRGTDDAYLCDGLTRDITTDLAKFQDLLVISAKSAFEYRDSSIDAKSLGRELGARYVLSGSVLRSNEQIRVNAQLAETRTGIQVWSNRIDRDLENLLSTQDEIVRHVVSSISTEVGSKERTRAIRMDPKSANAYDAFLRGNYHWWQFVNVHESKKEWIECQKWFEQATQLDPSYARPWAWLAYTTVEGYRRGWSDESALKRAEEFAQASVRLGMNDYDAHWALGYCHRFARRFEQAISEYAKACALNPNDADLIIERAELLTYTGRHREAVGELEESITLNPQCAYYCRSSLAWALYFLERYGDSLIQLSYVTNLSKDDLLVKAASHARNADSYAQAGQPMIAQEEASLAAATISDLLRLAPDWSVAHERKLESFERPSDRDHWLSGLRSAGLPEH